MKAYRVRFLPGNQFADAAPGTALAEAARQAGINLRSPCGGKGICGKCKVWIIAGEERRECLACRTTVDSDLLVEIPEQESGDQIMTAGQEKIIKPDTGIRVVLLEIPEILPGEKVSVWERVQSILAAQCGKERTAYTASLAVVNKLYQTIRSGRQQIYAVLEQDELLDAAVDKPQPAVLAIDLGTTTLAGYLIDAVSGRITAAVSRKNPQSAFGADVISRADYVLAHDGREMAACVRDAVGEMAVEAAVEAGIGTEQIYLTVLVGNTCMHHLFLELSPEALVHAPYSPVIRQGLVMSAGPYLNNMAPGSKLKLLPVIAGFVGADTTACLLACDFEEEERLTLLMDIGTNGELVLGNRYRSAACSTAAGPAFEGARIECGMRGTRGAIEHVIMEEGELSLKVIGDCQPEGLCGSGLLDIIAILVEYGFVDSMGMLQNPDSLSDPAAIRNKQRICGSGMEARFILFFDEETGRSVYITQKDIGEVQLAKAAMAAGIRILCERLAVQTEQIEQVLIAGAFGNYMNPDSACKIGLIPASLRAKIKGIGNAAGAGAVQAAISRERWLCSQRLAEHTEFAELASRSDFSDIFVEELEFPIS